MIRTIIIDDESSARKIIGNIVRSLPDKFDIIAEAVDIKSATDAIKRFKPELVLLDIDLPDGNAFRLLEQLGKIEFKIIFITAYSEYAIQAFKFSALDYILKPVISTNLINALEKTSKTIEMEDVNLKLKNLLNNIYGQPTKKKLVLKSSDSIISIDITDIYFCESDGGSYTRFHFFDDKEFLVSRPLKEYDLLLSGFNFFRVHKSYLVNMDKISRYSKQDGGTIILHNQFEIPVSNRKRDRFLEKFLAL